MILAFYDLRCQYYVILSDRVGLFFLIFYFFNLLILIRIDDIHKIVIGKNSSVIFTWKESCLFNWHQVI
jgi:hypothetical protein